MKPKPWPTGPDPPDFGDPLDPYRCSTLDGWPVDPTEAVAHALVGQVRRAIVGADSVVTDLGRLQRLSQGPLDAWRAIAPRTGPQRTNQEATMHVKRNLAGPPATPRPDTAGDKESLKRT